MKLSMQQSDISAEKILTNHKNSIPADSEEKPEEYANGSILKMLENLVDSELFFQQIMQNIEYVIWLRESVSGKILYVSPGFEKVWGLSCESIYANPILLIESVHPEDRVQVMASRSHGNHKSYNQVYRILRPDGSLRWIFSRTFIIKNGTQDSKYLFCIAQDITDQKKVELELRRIIDRSREQFDLSRKLSLARKPDSVLKTVMSAHELRTAQRSSLLFFNNPVFGPSRGIEIVATWLSTQTLSPWQNETNLYEDPGFWGLLHPHRMLFIKNTSQDPRLTPPTRDLMMQGQIQSVMIFPLVTLGQWRGYLVVYYEKEHLFDHIDLRHLKVLVDQAAITLYNLQLLEAEEGSRHDAEKANEIKTEFLAMITHELRTPLTSIIGFTTTLLADDVSWEPEEQHDFIQTIQREADRLQELIDHLLVLSRLEAGMLPITQIPYSLHQIMQDALPQLSTLTQEHTLMTHIPTNLPLVYVDAKRIAQVLVNLVRNASAYSPKGTEIVITTNVRSNHVQIEVSDQGPGISPSEYKHVFKAFRRGKKVEEDSPKGAGLGLAICKGLIETHGGRIWIKKKTTPGTTVAFTIPLTPTQPFSIPLRKEE